MRIILSSGLRAVFFAAGLSAFFCNVSPAAADVFTIDPNQSSLTLSGGINGSPFTEQSPGSLTTTYNGTIQASQSGGTIQFTGLSLVTARTNGSWYPGIGGTVAFTSPADYGGTVNFFGTSYAAFRSLQLDVTSPPITVTSGQFSPSSLTFSFTTNTSTTLDYNTPLGSGSKVLTGNSTNNVLTNATIVTIGSTQTLTLGVNVTFTFSISGFATPVTVAGKIVATRSTAAALLLQTPAVTNHAVTLRWQTTAAQNFQVLSTSNFVSWQTNASNVTSASTNYTWTGTNPAPYGFYRLAN